MPRQSKEHNLGSGGIPGPRKTWPFPELGPQGIGKKQDRKSRKDIGDKAKEEKEVQRNMGRNSRDRQDQLLGIPLALANWSCRRTS